TRLKIATVTLVLPCRAGGKWRFLMTVGFEGPAEEGLTLLRPECSGVNLPLRTSAGTRYANDHLTPRRGEYFTLSQCLGRSGCHPMVALSTLPAIASFHQPHRKPAMNDCRLSEDLGAAASVGTAVLPCQLQGVTCKGTQAMQMVQKQESPTTPMTPVSNQLTEPSPCENGFSRIQRQSAVTQSLPGQVSRARAQKPSRHLPVPPPSLDMHA
ncbi:hypothetical protein BaRGS_00025950, partial [Batillaria attramentaria]